MSNCRDENISDKELEALFEESASNMLPEDISLKVNPWKKSMYRVLSGAIMSTVTLNYLCMNYILPAAGFVLMLLGLRVLRRENKWFRRCFAVLIVETAYIWILYILNTSLFGSMLVNSEILIVLYIFSSLLRIIVYIFLSLGLASVQKNAGKPANFLRTACLPVCYAVISAYGLLQLSGFIIPGILLIMYILIFWGMYKTVKNLNITGYSIKTAVIKVSDGFIAIILSLVLIFGGACGYLFCGGYPMDWSPVNADEHAEVETIKSQLAKLGFPEYVLNDLTPEDISACEGALQVVSDVIYESIGSGLLETGEDDELMLTGVGVQVPGENMSWIVFHHFLWTTDPQFYGTESIQLWPPYDSSSDIWSPAGEVTGRVLFDRGADTFAANYYSLGPQIYTSDNAVFGEQTAMDIFAEFSLPKNGENCRGYVAYPVYQTISNSVLSSWANYTHQKSWAQYPVMSATQRRITEFSNSDAAFTTVQSALQFDAKNEAELLR